MQLKSGVCNSRNLISFINNFSAYHRELKKQLNRAVDIFMHALLYQLQSWFINQATHSGRLKTKRQDEYKFLTINNILTSTALSLLQKWLLFQLSKRQKDQFYQREDLTYERPKLTTQSMFSIIRKKQPQGKLAKNQVQTLRNVLENHKFTSNFTIFFSDRSRPTNEKQWGTSDSS